MQRRFHRFQKPAFPRGCDPVLHHVHFLGKLPGIRSRFLRAVDLPKQPDPDEALALEERKELRRGSLLRHLHAEQHQHRFIPERSEGGFLDARRAVRLHGPAAFRAIALCQAREEQFQVVVDLRDGAHGGPGGLDLIGLLNGNRWRDAADLIHLRLVHPVEKLADIRRKGFHIAALPLRIDGLKGER